ncbi:DUF1853 family protein [Ichthyenterobacterium sp. W332]|uniref:DUF1853 family protein n=1 Tax=Microcosmobacter mediterraneus TaxID=3075607 RepID=A0ABU2YNT5_9FLAO|nr:DUF1853 family protein [Ichthyenterobacterium sp. W332]MDT0559487.1 DUF1853 family protein [Ichthyenterobacterium sp. W332]
MSINSTTELQFNGFLNTPNLWKKENPLGVNNLELNLNYHCNNLIIKKKNRLGKLAEQFVIHCLKQDDSVKLLAESLQIQQNKTTIGEIDCLFIKKNKPIHLEIVYKFYLYEHTFGNTELKRWIGPNRNDTLIKKLEKLQTKQFPLLYNQNTKPYLQNLGYKADDFLQQLCFKAQLFVPYDLELPKFELLNTDCVQGIYIKRNNLDVFEGCSFYIPTKLDWLLEINPQVNWLSFEEFKKLVEISLKAHRSSLCWIKHSNNNYSKCFVVWW